MLPVVLRNVHMLVEPSLEQLTAVCLLCQLTVKTAWVEARRTARTAAGAEGRGNSVAARPPLPLHPLRRQAAGWPAAGAAGPAAGAALAPETETGGKRGRASH